MQIIPLNAVASQTENIILNGQICQVNVYQKFFGLFVDLYVDNELIIGGVIAQNLNRIVRYSYLGFLGDLVFQDTQGNDNPEYTGLGDRWLLLYLSPEELAVMGFT